MNAQVRRLCQLAPGSLHAPRDASRKDVGLNGSQKIPVQGRFLGSSSFVQTPRASIERQGRESVLLRAEQEAATSSSGDPPPLAPDAGSHIVTLATSAAAINGVMPSSPQHPAPTPGDVSGVAGRAARADPRCRGSAAAHGLVRDDLIRLGQASPAHGPVPRRPARGPARRPAQLPQPGPAPPAVAGAAHPRTVRAVWEDSFPQLASRHGAAA